MIASMRPSSLRIRFASIVGPIAFGLALGGCGPSVSSLAPAGTAAAATPAPPEATAPPASALPSVVPSTGTGFVFDPESIVGYYESIGYACAPRRPSSTAADHQYQSCQLVDPDGRTRSLGIVTDPADNVADASFSIRGAATEAVLDPSGVLEPFGAFLGAFLGEDQGTALLPWLAEHLGDAEARTTLGDLTIATYTDTPTDHTKLTLEVASQAYLDSPAPSP
jgi:hypothetical protein